jgi:hypothetical protein
MTENNLCYAGVLYFLSDTLYHILTVLMPKCINSGVSVFAAWVSWFIFAKAKKS